MKTIDQAEFTANLAQHLAEAAQLDSPVLIERGGETEGVVIVSDRDCPGMPTTIELLSDEGRAARLLRSLAERDAAAPAQASAAE